MAAPRGPGTPAARSGLCRAFTPVVAAVLSLETRPFQFNLRDPQISHGFFQRRSFPVLQSRVLELREAFWRDGDALPDADRVCLRDMAIERSIRELRGTTLTLLAAVRKMFDPKDGQTRKMVASPCCTFSHRDVHLPPVFAIDDNVLEFLEIGRNEGDPLPVTREAVLVSVPLATLLRHSHSGESEARKTVQTRPNVKKERRVWVFQR